MPVRSPIPTWTFAMVVVRAGRRVLLVLERDGTWSVPGGRMESLETIEATARREVLEESGLTVDLEGILGFQHTPIVAGEARLRVFFVARPVDDASPKTTADSESDEARWFTREELSSLPLRSAEVLALVDQALNGPVYPMSLLGREG